MRAAMKPATQAYQPRYVRSKSKATRLIILEAGKASFLKNGVIGTTMEEIARIAKVSPMTVYRHFGTKEDLLAGVITAFCDELLDQELGTLAEGESLRDTLRDFAWRFFKVVFDPETIELNRIVVGESRRSKALGRLYYERGPKATIESLASYLRSFAKMGHLTLDDPRRAAECFCLVLRGYAHQRLMLGVDEEISRKDLDRQVEDAIALIVKTDYPPIGGAGSRKGRSAGSPGRRARKATTRGSE
jgi:TetR/AcrR family transcriptional repressor of mexJK operon